MKRTYYLFAIIILVPLSVFILNFKSQYISNDNSDWADFSTYLGSFIALANLLVFIVLTKELHDYNLRKDLQQFKSERPIISFRLKGGNQNKYFAENVGKGSALNVIICGDLGNNKWNEAYIYYCFSANTEKEVCVQHNNALLALYQDIYGNKYVSYMDNDELRYFDVSIEEKEKKYPEELKRSRFQKVQPTWIT